MIIDNHTPLLCLVSFWRSTASIFSRHLCPAPIVRETVHSSFQSRFILACVFNVSDDLRDQLVLVVLSRTYRAGGAPLFICQEFCAYWVLSDPFPCIVWDCIPLWIFKVMDYIWDINSIFMCADAPSTTYLEMSSSTSSTSSSTSSSTTYAIETPTSSAATVSPASIINTTLSEADRWKVVRWVEYWNHGKQLSVCFDKCRRVWWPTDVDFCLQLCIWWHNIF